MTTRPGISARSLILIAALVAGIGAVAALMLAGAGPREPERFAVAGSDPLSADEMAEQFFRVAPEMLGVIYAAFNETGEAAIYDALAEVAAGDALAALYLERVGAMAGGGLDTTEAADQQIHAMEMLRIDARRTGTTFTWDARWRVVGTVGHATHLHVRGNIYAAVLTLEPVDGRWRFVDFALTDVDRTEVGQLVPAEDA